jgi:hypothetical protein
MRTFCNVCWRSVVVDSVLVTTALHFRTDSGLSPFRIRVLLYFVRGKDRHAVATFCDPATLLRRIATLRAEILGGWIVPSAVDLASSVSRGVNMNDIAVVVKLLFSGRFAFPAQGRVDMSSAFDRSGPTR